MHWRLNKYIVETTINYLRRVFSYNSEWSNQDIELVTFSEGKEPLVYEAFAEKIEKYPAILVTTGGGTLQPTGFNDLIQMVDDDIVSLGQVNSSTLLINNALSIKAALPSSTAGLSLRGLSIDSAWSGVGTGGDNIAVKLYKNYTTSPVMVASASIEGHTSKVFVTSYAEFNQTVVLDSDPYHLVLSSTADSPYYIGMNTSYNSNYLYNSTGIDVASSGSIVSNLYLPSFIRIGGNFKGSLSIRIHSKNDTKTVYNLSELVSMYMTLAKHAQLSRIGSATNGMKLENLDSNTVAEFLTKGIFIGDIKLSNLETRRRSDQEIIYIITVTIDILTEWFQDFSADTITDISLLIKTFLGGDYENAWNSSEI